MVKRIWCAVIVCCIANAGAQSVQGTIVDALNGMPVEGATVAILERAISAKTDLHGRYQLSSVPPGTYTLRANVEGYIKNTKKIILKSRHEVGASDLDIDMKLYPRSSDAEAAKGVMTVKYFFPGHANVSITIVDGEGNKVRRVFDRSRRGGMRSYSWDGKDDNGDYVPAGEYSARIACRTMTMMRKLVWKGKGEESSKSEMRNSKLEDTEEGISKSGVRSPNPEHAEEKNPESEINRPQSEEPKTVDGESAVAEEPGEEETGIEDPAAKESSSSEAERGDDSEEEQSGPQQEAMETEEPAVRVPQAKQSSETTGKVEDDGEGEQKNPQSESTESEKKETAVPEEKTGAKDTAPDKAE